jgi:hypothetical protein
VWAVGAADDTCRSGDCGLRTADGRNCLVVLPSTAKRIVEGDQLGACHPPRDGILDFKSKLLSLGIQDVDVIRVFPSCSTVTLSSALTQNIVRKQLAGTLKSTRIGRPRATR